MAGGARLYGRRSAVIWRGARLYDAMILMATHCAGACTLLGPQVHI
jgi:hypothetical protein